MRTSTATALAALALLLPAGAAHAAPNTTPTPDAYVAPEPDTDRLNATSTTYSQRIAASATTVFYKLHYDRTGTGVSVYGVTITGKIGATPGVLCVGGQSSSIKVCPSYKTLGYKPFQYRVYNNYSSGISTYAYDSVNPYGISPTKLHYLP